MSEQRTKHLINKWLIVLLFAAASILSAISAKDVKINYNLADYLNGDTQTKIALDIINDEFGATGTMQVLAKNVSADMAEDICEKIEGIENVLNVNFDKYDEAYYKDNNALFIFVIIMIIFRSLSLPVILVAIIQGAIFIAMSTQLLGDGIFFMSYIVTTCILMGATIDYGILMSSNYAADRIVCGKERSLEMSVETAMPTIFTSGLILAVCGFVIHFISSQNSISTVGLLLGIGSICSTIMVTVVLPSVLYLTDSFVLKFSLRKKGKA